MEKKSLGLFLVVLGFIFLGIALVTIWSMFFGFDATKGLYIILAIPLMVFSVTTIFFGFYLITRVNLGLKTKGLILLVDGLIPIIASAYAMLDPRLSVINDIRILVLLPLTLVGIFIIVYSIFLLTAEAYIDGIKTRKRANKILGIISIAIGLANIAAFIVLTSISGEQPVILSVFWLLIGAISIYFGVHLFIKKVEEKKKYTKRKR